MHLLILLPTPYMYSTYMWPPLSPNVKLLVSRYTVPRQCMSGDVGVVIDL